ncbi:hypothetical protein HK405_003222 [Cladochytrium tenue]|nr:hypothetical protein HK405_003222 [Cladochytrium tenue]
MSQAAPYTRRDPAGPSTNAYAVADTDEAHGGSSDRGSGIYSAFAPFLRSAVSTCTVAALSGSTPVRRQLLLFRLVVAAIALVLLLTFASFATTVAPVQKTTSALSSSSSSRFRSTRPGSLSASEDDPPEWLRVPLPDSSRLAVAVKTGINVASDRLPIQLLTFLRHVQNFVVIGEAPGIRVGDLAVVDVYTGQYEASLARNESRCNKGSHLLRRGDQITADASSIGWQRDAHKNLPGLRVLHDRFPEADWYLMIDDDSYVFLDNLLGYLDTQDPAVPLYMGSPNYFVGCDGVRNFADGPGFAHGGSGILMSRGAVDKLMPILDECIIKYYTCWGGDIRIALCMRDAGIKLEGGIGFYGGPPIRENRFPWNACERPKVFHHLLPSQMQRFWALEEENRAAGRPDIMSAVFSAFIVERDPLLVNATGDFDSGFTLARYNLPGDDFDNVKIEDLDGGRDNPPAACAAKCHKESRCLAWTVDRGNCWLKDRVPQWKENDSDKTWAGYIPSKYKCKDPGSR